MYARDQVGNLPTRLHHTLSRVRQSKYIGSVEQSGASKPSGWVTSNEDEMDQRTITQWMLSEKIALSDFQAGHIYEGLKLFKCATLDAQKRRVSLYRKWRPKTDKKNQVPTWQAFELAIAGIDPDDVQPRQIEMEMK
jgi:hypothetical protein